MELNRFKLFLFLIVFVLFKYTNAQEKPNIIFILADDLGYGDLSCYGAQDIETPHIDALAKSGIQFTRAYANSTVCSPSRAAILTGNYPDYVGVPGVIRDMPDNTWGNLKDDLVTLPEALKKVQYNTAIIGKWHLGYKAPDIPKERGFDYFKGFLGDMMDDYYTHRRAGVNWMRENEQEIDPQGHATDLFTDWTLDYLEKHRKEKKPFFLYLAYTAPHNPVQPPENWLEKVQKREPDASLKRQKLIALIEHLDYNVGRILDYLKASHLDKNTIVVFTSDNGGALHYGASNQPYSGGKGDLLEGGIRIPCLVKLPNHSKNAMSDSPILLMDFYPTLVELAKGKTENELPSKPINELLERDKVPSREMVWMRREGFIFGGRAYYAISDGRYKLVQNRPFTGYELFDLKEDPLEKNPLDNPELKKKLMTILMKHIQVSGKIPWQ
ncbi:sulfatase family protein [Gaetbulibacter aestuarii]|uniref:Sulfatase-like hydrolase/transferase n=1 Tax=Gaetbulibacter aestuarii TaxID=1502358 RepID=A0ABW7N3Q5_9FLAO